MKFILLKTTIFAFLSFLNEINNDYDKELNSFDGNSKELFDLNFVSISGKINKRNITDMMRTKAIFYKTSNGQKAISYIGPKLWDSMPNYLKEKRTIATFKHGYKTHYLKTLL